MKRRVCKSLSVLLFLVGAGRVAAASWPTTEFRVDFAETRDATATGQATAPVLQEPGRVLAPGERPATATSKASAQRIDSHRVLAAFFEQSLHEAAVALEAEGFEPPSLPVFTDGNGTYFKVHVFDFSKAEVTKPEKGNELPPDGIYHSSKKCGDRGVSEAAWFGVNSLSFVPLTPSREAYLYVVLAHELTHTVQERYAATAEALGCSANTEDYKAVSEGTADAAAYKLAQARWPEYYLEFGKEMHYSNSLSVVRYTGDNGLLDTNLVGWRPYRTPFLDYSATEEMDKDQAAYNASSFWFNLVDRYGIRILDHLFRQPLRHGDYPSLVRWLDDGLESYSPSPGGLYTVFPHFVTEFASQAGSRFPEDKFSGFGQEVLLASKYDPSGELKPYSDAQHWWIERIAGECHPVRLSPYGTEGSTLTVELKRLSAGCIEIEWEGFSDSFELHIEVESADLRLLDQVNIGLVYEESGKGERYCYDEVRPHYTEPLRTCLHEKPFTRRGPGELSYVRDWTESGLPFTGSGRRILTLSNVARDAERTRPIRKKDNVQLRIGYSRIEAQDGRRYDLVSAGPTATYFGAPTLSPENLYGITTVPTSSATRLSFNIPIADSDMAYGVHWMGPEPELGYSGIYQGIVSRVPAGNSMISSSLCPRHANGMVGKVTRFDRDDLWVEIDADLCEMTMPPPLDGHFPQVDRLQVRLQLPFGWRYAAGNQPVDIVTPGMQVFIGRHSKRVPMVLSGDWQSAGSDQAAQAGQSAAEGSGAGPAGPGPAFGGQGSSLPVNAPCDCSCEEYSALVEAGSEAKAGGDKSSMMRLSGRMMACLQQCQRPYMLCVLDHP